MKTQLQRVKRILPTLAVAGLVVACQTPNPSTPQPQPDVLLNPAQQVDPGQKKMVKWEKAMAVKAAEGGMLTSADGHMKIVIPPGALSADTQVRFMQLPSHEVKPGLSEEGLLHIPGLQFFLDLGHSTINPNQQLMVTGAVDDRFVAAAVMLEGSNGGTWDPAKYGLSQGEHGGWMLSMPVKGPQDSVAPGTEPEFGTKDWYVWEWGSQEGLAMWEAEQAEKAASGGKYKVQHGTYDIPCTAGPCSSYWGNTTVSGMWFGSFEAGSSGGPWGCDIIVKPACSDPGGGHGSKVELQHCVLQLVNSPESMKSFGISNPNNVTPAILTQAGNMCKSGNTEAACKPPVPDDAPKPASDPSGGTAHVTWDSDEPLLNNDNAYPAWVVFKWNGGSTDSRNTGTGGNAGRSFPEIWDPVYGTDSFGQQYIKRWELRNYSITMTAWYSNGVRNIKGSSKTITFTQLGNGPFQLTIPKNRPNVNLQANVTGTPNTTSIPITTKAVTSNPSAQTNNQTFTGGNASFSIKPQVYPDYTGANFSIVKGNSKRAAAAWIDFDEANVPSPRYIRWDETYNHKYAITFNSTITGKFFYDSNDVSVAADQQPLEDQYKWNDKVANQVTSVVFAHPVSLNPGRPTSSTSDRPLEAGKDDLTFSNVDASRLAWGVSGQSGNVSASKDVTCGVPLVGSAAYTTVAGGEVNVDLKANLPKVEIPVSEELANLSLVMRYRLVRKDDPSIVLDRIMNLPKAVGNKITFSLPTHDPLHQAKCWVFEPYRIEDPTFEYQVFTPTNDFKYPSVDNISRGQPTYLYPVQLKALWVAPKYRVRQ